MVREIASIQSPVRTILVAAAVALALAWLPAATAVAQDTDAMAKRIERQLGAAKFKLSGDVKNAKKAMAEISELIEELRATAPNHAKLEKLDKSYKKLSGDITKKMLQRIKSALNSKRSRIKSSIRAKQTDRAEKYRDELAELMIENAATFEDAGEAGAKLKGEIEAYLAEVDAALGGGTAAAPPATSATPDQIASRLNRSLSGIEFRIGSDRKRAAQELDQARQQFQQLKAAAPSHPKIAALESKLDQLTKKLGQSAAETAPAAKAAKPTAAKPAAKTAGAQKLPGGITYRLDNMAKQFDRAEQAIAKGGRIADSAKLQLDGAAELMAEIHRTYGDKVAPDHPKLVAAEQRLAALRASREAALQAADAAKQREQAALAEQAATSELWLNKLNPFFNSGSPKFVTAAKTGKPSELNRRRLAYAEATAVFAEYQQAAFPAGKTRALQNVEGKLSRELAGFPAAYKASVDGLVEWAEGELNRQFELLAQWAKDPKKARLLLGDQLDNARRGVAAVATAAPEDPRNAELEQRMAALVEANAARRQNRIQNTFLIADRFQEDGIDAIKTTAAGLVQKGFADAMILRVTVISPEWREEDVEEWTDTTKTKIRRRITRSVTAQVAGKRGEEVYLYNVHVAKNRRSDGSWGALYGNLHQDPHRMLEENVKRNAP